MSNVVKFSINGDTNADQVTDKVKKSVSNLEKNIQGIENRFKSFGKDLFLSFAAPMVLLNAAMSAISGAIQDARRRAQEGLDLLAKGDSMFVSSHERRMAAYLKERQERDKESESAKEGRAESTKLFLETTPEGQKLLSELRRENLGNYLINPRFTANMAGREDVQKRALDAFSASPEGQAALKWEETQQKQKENQKQESENQASVQKEVDRMPTSFKGPEGFSNVVGVGANPVLEAMASQLEEAKKTNELLAQLVTPSRTNSWLDTPAGATSTAAPSRAGMLKGK
jgi:hypothetical protein